MTTESEKRPLGEFVDTLREETGRWEAAYVAGYICFMYGFVSGATVANRFGISLEQQPWLLFIVVVVVGTVGGLLLAIGKKVSPNE